MFLTDLRRTVVLGLAFALVGLIGCNRPETGPVPTATEQATVNPGPTSGGDKKAVTDLTKVKPDLNMTAQEFLDQIVKGEAASKQKYDGKVIELNGKVDSVFPDAAGTVYVWLAAGTGLERPACRTLDQEPWASLAPGQVVTIRGLYKKSDFSVPELLHCVVIEAAPNPAISISTQKLAAEAKADPEGTEKKYEDKHLLVEGEVLEHPRDDDTNRAHLLLKGEGALNVICAYSPFANGKMFEGVMKGQKVRCSAKWIRIQDNGIILENSLLIKGTK